jgi:predicted NAD/FAD-dependent oxidoreductase
MSKKNIAVIGCGISSAAFYHFIDKNKFNITFVEKSRGVGGRMPAKRIDNLSFDHGASCFGAIRSEAFTSFIDSYIKEGVVKEWQGSFRIFDLKSNQSSDIEKKKRLISAFRSNYLAKRILHKAIECEKIIFNEKVVNLDFDNDQKINIICDSGSIYNNFDYVVSSAPAPQTLQFFPKEFIFRAMLTKVEYDPAFAVMLSFKRGKKIDFSHLAIKNSIISRISYENSKDDRNFELDCFVINSTNDYSIKYINNDLSSIENDIINEFIKITNLDKNNIINKKTHRWLYANAKKSYDMPPLFDQKLSIAAIGDYIKGPRVELSFESGQEMAELLNF